MGRFSTLDINLDRHWRTLSHASALSALIASGDRVLFRGLVQRSFDDFAIMHLSAHHREAQRPTFAVDNRIYYCGSTTPSIELGSGSTPISLNQCNESR